MASYWSPDDDHAPSRRQLTRLQRAAKDVGRGFGGKVRNLAKATIYDTAGSHSTRLYESGDDFAELALQYKEAGEADRDELLDNMLSGTELHGIEEYRTRYDEARRRLKKGLSEAAKLDDQDIADLGQAIEDYRTLQERVVEAKQRYWSEKKLGRGVMTALKYAKELPAIPGTALAAGLIRLRTRKAAADPEKTAKVRNRAQIGAVAVVGAFLAYRSGVGVAELAKAGGFMEGATDFSQWPPFTAEGAADTPPEPGADQPPQPGVDNGGEKGMGQAPTPDTPDGTEYGLERDGEQYLTKGLDKWTGEINPETTSYYGTGYDELGKLMLDMGMTTEDIRALKDNGTYHDLVDHMLEDSGVTWSSQATGAEGEVLDTQLPRDFKFTISNELLEKLEATKHEYHPDTEPHIPEVAEQHRLDIDEDIVQEAAQEKMHEYAEAQLAEFDLNEQRQAAIIDDLNTFIGNLNEDDLALLYQDTGIAPPSDPNEVHRMQDLPIPIDVGIEENEYVFLIEEQYRRNWEQLLQIHADELKELIAEAESAKGRSPSWQELALVTTAALTLVTADIALLTSGMRRRREQRRADDNQIQNTRPQTSEREKRPAAPVVLGESAPSRVIEEDVEIVQRDSGRRYRIARIYRPSTGRSPSSEMRVELRPVTPRSGRPNESVTLSLDELRDRLATDGAAWHW